MTAINKQQTHRPSLLKQQNKKHHTLGHKTKRQLASLNKGRVNNVLALRKAKAELNRKEKKNVNNQKKKHKLEAAYTIKQKLGTNDTAPFLVLIVPMSENVKSSAIITSLCQADTEAKTNINFDGVTHIGCKRFKKRLSFIAPSVVDRTSILDAAKVSDSVLFVWDATKEDMMDEGRMLLTIMKSQAIPTVVHAISGLDSMSQKKKIRVLKELKKDMSIEFSEQSKVFSLDNEQETLLLLRQFAEQKKHNMYFRDKRSHMLAEKLEFVEEENGMGTLKVTGYIRGQDLSANNIIHIPGWEDYQIKCIEALQDPHLIGKTNSGIGTMAESKTEAQRYLQYMEEENSETTLKIGGYRKGQHLSDHNIVHKHGWEDYKLDDIMDPHLIANINFGSGAVAYPKTEFQRCLQSTEEVDLSDVEEDMLEPEELKSDVEEFSDDSFEDDDSDVESNPASESMELECNSDAESLSPVEDEEDKEERPSELDDIAYDKEIDYEAEMLALEQEVDDNKMFPDEIDTPFEQKAMVRFKKYRGLESFRTSTWNQYEHLPVDFRKILRLKAYQNLRKGIFRTTQKGVKMGSYVCVHLKNVWKRVYDEHILQKTPLILVSLLVHEQELGMLNVVIKSHSSGHMDAIKSKDRLIFHVGFRRFSNCPIFSEHSSANKFLFLRYFHPTTTVVASMYAPITFGPSPVSVFKERMDGTGLQDLVATGSVHSVDHQRIICKRICLSGHPFKIKPHVTVVRYMFFDREDIEFFKKIELRTKRGARGKILGPIGTHGHMKCHFKEKLNSQDVVFLQLYKRVFPKWQYEPMVHRLISKAYSTIYEDEQLTDQEPKAKKIKTVHFSEDL